jgi:hypothetical protein
LEASSAQVIRDRPCHAGVPRGIANDLMTAAVAMAGGIDEIADAAG